MKDHYYRACERCRERRSYPSEFKITRTGKPSRCCVHCEPVYRACETCGSRCRVPDQIRPTGRKCCECKAKVKRAGARRYYEANREKIIAKANAWNQEHPERHQQHLETAWNRLRSDPERWEDYLAAGRMKLRCEGKIVGTQLKRKNVVGAYEPPPVNPNGGGHGKRLPVDPLREWIEREFPGWGVKDLARWIGVDDSHLGKILNGKQQFVSEYVVDRIFVGADCPHLLCLLYPGE